MEELNNATRIIADFLNLNATIRDTLEYVMPKTEYSFKAYETRKKVLNLVLSNENSPLMITCKNSGEAGEKLLKKFNEFYEDIYGDTSSIVKVRGETIDVDKAQNLTLLELVIPLREEVNRILHAHIAGAKKNNQYNLPLLEEAVKDDERHYRGFAYLLLFNELEKSFLEYNKARNEAKGAITPQSNFIQNDINKIIQLFYFVRQNGQVPTLDYYDMVDPLFALIEATGGRRELKKGTTFRDVFTNVKELITKYLQPNEVNYQKSFGELFRLMVEDSKKMKEKMEAQGEKKLSA